MPEFIDAEIVQPTDRVLNVECEVLTSINNPHSTLNIEPTPPLTSCAAHSIENRKTQIGNTTIRPATLDDLPFIDALQKKNSKAVGFFPTQALEGKIRLGHVLVAETGTADCAEGADLRTEISAESAKSAVGYCIGNDQYFKRDDVGCIFQMNVVPEYRRSLVAARLLQAQFERSSWGCKLYCCWCAQDLAANRFWEAMGFVPLAFRTGARRVSNAECRVSNEFQSGQSEIGNRKSAMPKARIHIFWQKRIRRGDESTPWWFPCKTGGGSLREDRIVLPIPPGTRWDEAMPTILPQSEERRETSTSSVESLREESGQPRAACCVRREFNRKSQIENRQSPDRPTIRMGGMWSAAPVKVKKKKRKIVHDPVLLQRARELRDRWLEQVNQTPLIAHAKYDVSRLIDAPPVEPAEPMRLLVA